MLKFIKKKSIILGALIFSLISLNSSLVLAASDSRVMDDATAYANCTISNSSAQATSTLSKSGGTLTVNGTYYYFDQSAKITKSITSSNYGGTTQAIASFSAPQYCISVQLDSNHYFGYRGLTWYPSLYAY